MTAEHRITTAVDAPAEEVWGLFMGVERWPTMIESYESARRLDSGPLRVGSEAIIKQPRLPRLRPQRGTILVIPAAAIQRHNH